jgi:hypothetical protein
VKSIGSPCRRLMMVKDESGGPVPRAMRPRYQPPSRPGYAEQAGTDLVLAEVAYRIDSGCAEDEGVGPIEVSGWPRGHVASTSRAQTASVRGDGLVRRELLHFAQPGLRAGGLRAFLHRQGKSDRTSFRWRCKMIATLAMGWSP